MRRREFLRQIVYIPVAGATIAVLVASCSDDSTSSDSSMGTDTTSADGTTTPSSGDKPTADVCSNADVTIASNHGHSLDISSDEVEAGAALVLTLTGPHTHQISLSADEVQAIAACDAVETTSSTTNGHTHVVTLTGIT